MDIGEIIVIRKNLVGQKFSRLTVVSLFEVKNKRSFWLCLCECGVTKVVAGSHLSYGGTKSCGCLQSQRRSESHTVHGLSKTNEYQIWIKIKSRCYSKSNPAYKNYGARGIYLSDEWLVFENFYKDMAPRPSLAHSIDRIDCNKGYSKENCRWATSKQQNNNRRNNILYEVDGITATLSQHCDRYDVSYKTVHQRIKTQGKPVALALSMGRP